MLSIKIYHVCGKKNPSLKNFKEGGKILAWLIYCEMRGSVGFLKGLTWTLLKAINESTKSHSIQSNEHTIWIAVKLRTRAVTVCWNHVLSPFPLRQHHLKQILNLEVIFNIVILSYNRPDCLEIFVEFKTCFFCCCLFRYPFHSHSLQKFSVTTMSQNLMHRTCNSTRIHLGLTRCLHLCIEL